MIFFVKGPGKRGHIVTDTNVSPFASVRNICCGHKFCVRDTKNVSQFAQPKKHHGQQCVRNNVSTFTRALRYANNFRLSDRVFIICRSSKSGHN